MEVVKNRKPHVLAVGVPAQGHVKPLMKLCRQIAKQGIKVTFANIQSIHDKILAAAKLSREDEEEDNFILTPIPDTRSPEDQRDTFNMEPFKTTLPPSLIDLIHRINASDPHQKITCLIFDLTFEWISDIAQKIGVEPFGFSSPSAASMAMVFQLPKLLEDGILDSNGNIKKGEVVRLSDDIPCWGEDEFGWSFPSNRRAQVMWVEAAAHKIYQQKINKCKWVLCNTCYELESSDLNPNFLPIGPLPDSESRPGSGSFYPEDASCLAWLDTKPPGSVIYVSFGSVAIFSQAQLDELAIGLELSGRAFLWVVRPGLANGSQAVYPDGFQERVGENGMIVGWAPQERVLSHPSVACFLSHCGWNSTMEGLSIGVPFLCWPYFADQFHNQKYICDKWETGLRISPDENGIRSRHEIKKKIDMLFSNDDLKANALAMKETCGKSVNEGGSSFKNLETFIDHIRNSTLLCL